MERVNGNIMLAFLAVTVTTALILAGCSKEKQEPVSEQPVISFDSRPATITAEEEVDTETGTEAETERGDSSESAEKVSENGDIAATVNINVTYEDGSPDIVEALDIDGVTDQPDETGSIITGYDGSGNLIYKRSDSSVTDAQGKMDVAITYEFYSLDYDFDLRIEPLYPENGGNIQSIQGSVISGGKSSDFTFETVGRRGQTGIWYAGICSCRNGVLGEYEGDVS